MFFFRFFPIDQMRIGQVFWMCLGHPECEKYWSEHLAWYFLIFWMIFTDVTLTLSLKPISFSLISWKYDGFREWNLWKSLKKSKKYQPKCFDRYFSHSGCPRHIRNMWAGFRMSSAQELDCYIATKYFFATSSPPFASESPVLDPIFHVCDTILKHFKKSFWKSVKKSRF